ncbi:hypothetical protein RIF29_10625 [Crotalaria pallida]|uniref:Uncharacterized protein n=1 Tax=Crotalaria pallida TaxID=3830 RepID=A0AAN9FVE5_CROPI
MFDLEYEFDFYASTYSESSESCHNDHGFSTIELGESCSSNPKFLTMTELYEEIISGKVDELTNMKGFDLNFLQGHKEVTPISTLAPVNPKNGTTEDSSDITFLQESSTPP